MSGRLPGKVAVVFGGGSVGPGWGNGKASAVKYAREGARVAVIDIQLDAARETVEIIRGEGGQAQAYACDISNEPRISVLMPEIIRQFGRVDILHNNVGAPIMGSVEDMPSAEWDRAQDLNLKGAFLTCRAVLPHMKANRAGVITNISSIAAIRHTGYPYAAYYASKAGLNQLTMSIALQYAPYGIRANTIMPGMMDTPHIYQAIVGQYEDDRKAMVEERSALCPMGRMGTGWDVANAAAFLASDEASYITGVNLPVDGGITCRI
jgi:NAD(P)-dependent dehydrogenase (short-subunit alcohol dehydrogenase family)